MGKTFLVLIVFFVSAISALIKIWLFFTLFDDERFSLPVNNHYVFLHFNGLLFQYYFRKTFLEQSEMWKKKHGHQSIAVGNNPAFEGRKNKMQKMGVRKGTLQVCRPPGIKKSCVLFVRVWKVKSHVWVIRLWWVWNK